MHVNVGTDKFDQGVPLSALRAQQVGSSRAPQRGAPCRTRGHLYFHKFDQVVPFQPCALSRVDRPDRLNAGHPGARAGTYIFRGLRKQKEARKQQPKRQG